MSARLLIALGASWALGCGPGAAPHTRSERIISQVVFADEELWHLGAEVRTRVVGVSSMADDSRYSGAAGLWPASVARPVGVEAIAALAPDLVVASEFTAPETRAALETLGVRTLQLEGFNGFGDYRRHVTALASTLAAADQGVTRIAGFDRAVESMRLRFADGTHPGVVSWQEGSIAGSETLFDDIAITAGFANVAAEHGIVGHHNISVETLVAWDPEYIVVSCDDDCPAREHDFATRPGIAATRAARRGHVVAIPGHHLYSVGAGMLEVVRRLGERKARDGQ